jgi:metal-sulfur cluster biosynthetic enzyme
MPAIEVDMSKVDQEVAHEVANDILLFFADIHDEGVSILDMIVSLGIVMEIMIEQSAGQVAHTRSH